MTITKTNAERAASIWNYVPVADFDICHKLYELTGWDGTHQVWNYGRRRGWVDYWQRGTRRSTRTGDIEDYREVSESRDTLGNGVTETASTPAYDLGYLLRRVPPGPFTLERTVNSWIASLDSGRYDWRGDGTEPEDAVAVLLVHVAESAAAAEPLDETR